MWLIHIPPGAPLSQYPLCSVWTMQLDNVAVCCVDKQLVKSCLNGKYWDEEFLELKNDLISSLWGLLCAIFLAVLGCQ